MPPAAPTARPQSAAAVPIRQLEVADGNLDPLLERNRVFAATGACAGLSISPANLPDHGRGSRTRPVPSRRPATNHRGRRCDMDARTRLVLIPPTRRDAPFEALVASAPQPSNRPTAALIAP